MSNPSETPRELALKVKTYRLFAVIFAVVGLVMMMYLYHNASEGGDVMVFLNNQSSIAMVLFPFVPAMIFSSISIRAEKQLKKLVGENKEKKSKDAAAKEPPKELAVKEDPKKAKDEPKKDKDVKTSK